MESNFLDHAIQSYSAVIQETKRQPRELVAIFWLPFGVGIICLASMLAALLKLKSFRLIIFMPLAITIGGLVLFSVIRGDIHIMVISLLPLCMAWWRYRKKSGTLALAKAAR